MYGPAARWGSANVLFLGASAQLPQRHDRWLGEPETVGVGHRLRLVDGRRAERQALVALHLLRVKDNRDKRP